MKDRFVRYFLPCVALALGCVLANAQDETLSAAAGDRYVISAKAGGVNFIEGTVTVTRVNGRSGLLLKSDKLEIGDRVETGSNGKAEILLNPGSFLRLGGSSAFEFRTTSLDDLQLKVHSGSAILEVFAAEEFKVAVSTPSSRFLLVETGVYRIDVLNGQGARLEVWKGAAQAAEGEVVKPGRAASATPSGHVSVAKFDRDEKDALDTWSKNRSKELAKLSAKLKRGDLRTELMRSYLGRRWNIFGSFGLWVYDPFLGGYCFLPFGYGWQSPYGFGYGHSMWWYELPPVVYMPPTTPSGGGPSGPTAPTATPIRTAGDRSPIPPFIRMEQLGGGGIRGGGPGRGDFGDSGGSTYTPSSSPSYSPPPSSPPPSSAPAPSTKDATGTKP